MYDIVADNVMGLYEVGDYLCTYTYPTTAVAPTGEAADADCPDCDYTFILELGPVTEKVGDLCDAWYTGDDADMWDSGEILSGFGLGLNTADETLLFWYDGAEGSYPAEWYPMSYGSSSSEGDTIGWDMLWGQYYY
jgi:hypothetical protein